MSHHHHSDAKTDSWRVDLRFGADDDTITATAELMIDDEIFEATGRTHLVPFDATLARELCVARALSGLAHQLVDDATRTVGRVAQAAADAAEEAKAVYATLDD